MSWRGTRRSHRAHRDANHEAISDALIATGAKVQDLTEVGNGCPDLLVGWRHRLLVMELKKSGKEKLNEKQLAWFEAWTGFPVHRANSPEEAIAILEDIDKEVLVDLRRSV